MIIKTKEKKFKKPGYYKKYLLGGLCGILAISSVAMTLETATSGMEMATLEKTENELIDTRRDLEETLVKTLSSRELKQKSEELGFAKPVDLVYITQILPVAKLP